MQGRAIAQAVCPWISIAAARLRVSDYACWHAYILSIDGVWIAWILIAQLNTQLVTTLY